MADVGLFSLKDSHFQIYAVAYHIHFNRIKVIEHISVVEIKVSDGVFVGVKTFIQKLLVIDIAFLHAQDGSQSVCGIQ